MATAFISKGKAGIHLEPARPQAGEVARAGRAVAGQAYARYDFKYDGLGFATLAFNNLSGIGRPGTGPQGRRESRRDADDGATVPLTLPWDETFDIGSDTETPIETRNTGAVRLHRQDRQVDDLDRSTKLTPEDEKRFMEAAVVARPTGASE